MTIFWGHIWLLGCSAWPVPLALLGRRLSQVISGLHICSAWPLLPAWLRCGLAWLFSVLGFCSAWSVHRGIVPGLVDVNNVIQLVFCWTDTHLSTALCIVRGCTDLRWTALWLDCSSALWASGWSSGSSSRPAWSPSWTSCWSWSWGCCKVSAWPPVWSACPLSSGVVHCCLAWLPLCVVVSVSIVPGLDGVNKGLQIMLSWTVTHLSTTPCIVGDCTIFGRGDLLGLAGWLGCSGTGCSGWSSASAWSSSAPLSPCPCWWPCSWLGGTSPGLLGCSAWHAWSFSSWSGNLASASGLSVFWSNLEGFMIRFTFLFSWSFSLIILIFSNLSILCQSAALFFSFICLSSLSVSHFPWFSSIYLVNHLVIAHLSSSILFFSFLSLLSCFFLSISSCLFLFSLSKSSLLFSYISFAFLLSSTSLFILSIVSSSVCSHFSWFVFCSSSFSLLCCSSSFLHFFQRFILISLISNLCLFSSCLTKCLLSCSGSLFQMFVIFSLVSFSFSFCLNFLSNWFFLFSLSFLCLTVSLSFSSIFHVFSFCLINSTQVLNISQLCSFLSFLSSNSSFSFCILAVSSMCFLNASSQFTISTSSYSPNAMLLSGISFGVSVGFSSSMWACLSACFLSMSLMSVFLLLILWSFSWSFCFLFSCGVVSGQVGVAW